MAAKLHRTFIDMPEALRRKTIDVLNARLADTLDLQTQLKQAHWNIKGAAFIAVHELFDSIAEKLYEFGDEIAERAVALGGQVHGTARVAAKSSSIPEYPLDAVDQTEHVEAVAERLGTYGKIIRSAIDETDKLGDKDTADLFTQISREIDKQRWFVEAHLGTK